MDITAALCFPKSFKKENGMTPTEYRKRKRLETKRTVPASPEELKGIGRKVSLGLEENKKRWYNGKICNGVGCGNNQQPMYIINKRGKS